MIDRLDVAPMTFAEFLEASGKSGLVQAVCEGDWVTVAALSSEYVDLLKDYLVVGGMPEAVEVWTRTQSFAKVRAVQKSVLADYDDDFKKHAPKELLPKIRLLWNNIPAQLAKENRKFVYTALKPGARAREYETALQWLEDAGMIHQVFRTCPPRLPLKAVRTHRGIENRLHWTLDVTLGEDYCRARTLHTAENRVTVLRIAVNLLNRYGRNHDCGTNPEENFDH